MKPHEHEQLLVVYAKLEKIAAKLEDAPAQAEAQSAGQAEEHRRAYQAGWLQSECKHAAIDLRAVLALLAAVDALKVPK